MYRKLSLFLFLSLNFSIFSHAQFLEVESGTDSGLSPNEYAAQILQNNDFQIISVNYEGDFDAMGAFTANGDSPIGVSHGMVLTTGRIKANASFPGLIAPSDSFAGSSSFPNITIDADLSQLDPDNFNQNIARMFVEFIPLTDTLVVDLIFASEEYPEYSCSAFNDVFGLFLSGPGVSGTFTNGAENIARIPNSDDYISINNLHPDDTCPAVNEEYYINNSFTGTGFPTPLVYDGLTTVIPIRWPVTPFETYTMKLAIADKGDAAFDSATFLQFSDCTSGFCRFFSPEKQLLIENCEAANVHLDLSEIEADIFPFEVQVMGTAENGNDYETLPSSFVLTEANPILDFDIIPVSDEEQEGMEYIELSVTANGEFIKSIYYYLKDEITLTAIQTSGVDDCETGIAISVVETASETYAFENTESFEIGPIATAINSDIQVSGLPYQTLFSPSLIKEVCVNIDHNWLSDVDLFLISPNGSRMTLSTDNGADGNDYQETCFTPMATDKITQGFSSSPAESAPFTGAWQPEGRWDYFKNTETNGTWTIQVKDDANGFIGTFLSWSITFHENILTPNNVEWASGDIGQSIIYEGSNPILTAEVNELNCSNPVYLEIEGDIFIQGFLNIEETICDPDYAVTYGDVVYDVNNPFGTSTLVGANYLGCDSTISVNLTFLDIPEDVILTEDYLEDQPFLIEGQSFDTPGYYLIPVNVEGLDCSYNIELSLLPPSPVNYYDLVENEESAVYTCEGGEYCLDISLYDDTDYQLLLDGWNIGYLSNFSTCNTITERYIEVPGLVFQTSKVWEITAINAIPVESSGKFSGTEDFLQHLNYVVEEGKFYGLFEFINAPKIATRVLPDFESISLFNEAEDDLIVLSVESNELQTGAIIPLTGTENEVGVYNPITTLTETFALNYQIDVQTEPSILFVDFVETDTDINVAYFAAQPDELCGDPVSATSICNGSEILDMEIYINDVGGAEIVATVDAFINGDVEMCIELCDAYGVCDTVTEIWTYTLVSVNEAEKLSQSINIFPNPTSSEVMINLSEVENSINSVEIFSLNGQEIRQKKIDNQGIIDTSDLATGVYLLRIDTENGVARKRLVVTR